MHYRRFALQVKKNAVNSGLSVASAQSSSLFAGRQRSRQRQRIPTPRNYNPTSDFARMLV